MSRPVLALPLALLLSALSAAQAPPVPQDADALWNAGHRAEALAVMESELATRPDDAALRLSLAQRQLQVQRCTAALATAAPLGVEGDAVRGPALYVLCRYEEALPLLAPDDPQQSLMRVDCLLALGRGEQADAALDRARAVRGEHDAAVLSLGGRRLAEKGRYDEAVAAFRAALDRDPLDRQALYGLGQALVRAGQREQGLAVMQRHRELVPLLDRRDSALQALDLDQAHASNHAALGDVERDLGLLDSAQQRYRRAEELAEPGELTPIVLRHARLLAEDVHDLSAALALLADAETRTPDPRLPVRAGDLLMGAGRAAEAEACFRRALALRPDDRAIAERLKAAQSAQAGRDGTPAAPGGPP